MAADIRIGGIVPEEVAKYAESIGIQRIGLYDNFVHIGSATTKKFWFDHTGTRVDTFGAAPVKTTEIKVTVLKRGMKGDNVKALQMLLIGHGADIEADGSFGAATESAVTAYQRKQGLEDDGSVGAKTWASLLGL
jgi:murein L,D-transpeptidase YcbB/YkuD